MSARMCLWYHGDAQGAAEFYAATFADSQIERVHHAPGDFPGGQQGDALMVEMRLLGMGAILLNGGPQFTHSEAFSIQVETTTQAETDQLWAALTGNGGAESQCGWCRDKWGVHWQITPRVLTEGMAHPDAAVRARVFAAMMTMGKIDIAQIERAVAG